MSGFLAVLDRRIGFPDAAEPEPPGTSGLAGDVLRAATDAMAFRGPDGTAVERAGPMGFGHCLLRTQTPGEQFEPGVVRDPGQGLWVVADARIDAREELVAKLRGAGPGSAWAERLSPASPAPELILAAYRAWGPDCPEHLIGDFAFVIWDEPRGALFATRDPLGIKPFFMWESAARLVMGNTLQAFFTLPDVLLEPDHAAIGEYMLFGHGYDEDATYFRGIRQVPAGSTVVCDREGTRVRKYWSLPAQDEVRLGCAREYVEEFEGLFHAAVADRLPGPGGTAVIQLSGGLDSGCVAAGAAHVTHGLAGGGPDLHAFTVGYRTLFSDPEGTFARTTAEALGIPHQVIWADDLYGLVPGVDPDSGQTAEPPATPWVLPPQPGLHPREPVQTASARLGRVSLTGWDGDALLYGDILGYLAASFRRGRPDRVLGALVGLLWEAWAMKRLPRIGLRGGLKSLRSRRGIDPAAGFPRGFFQPEFESSVGLEERWIRNSDPGGGASDGPRGRARWTVGSPVWSALGQAHSPEMTLQLQETRHPLLDVRLISLLLRLPVVPWCVEKGIFRRYLKRRLPESIWRRKKEGLRDDPLRLLFRKAGPEELASVEGIGPDAPVWEYVRPEMGRALSRPGAGVENQLQFIVRAHSLNNWLCAIWGEDLPPNEHMRANRNNP